MRIPIFSNLVDKITGEKPPLGDMDMLAQMPSPQFPVTPPQLRDEFYRYQEHVHELDSKEPVLAFIDQAPLSARCKRAWNIMIHSGYDQNKIFSNLSKKHAADISYLWARILVIGLRVGQYKTDRRRPELAHLEMQFADQYKHYVTRAEGPDRERLVGTKMQILYEAKQRLQREKPKEGG